LDGTKHRAPQCEHERNLSPSMASGSASVAYTYHGKAELNASALCRMLSKIDTRTPRQLALKRHEIFKGRLCICRLLGASLPWQVPPHLVETLRLCVPGCGLAKMKLHNLRRHQSHSELMYKRKRMCVFLESVDNDFPAQNPTLDPQKSSFVVAISAAKTAPGLSAILQKVYHLQLFVSWDLQNCRT
jgi:hypothetical protein